MALLRQLMATTATVFGYLSRFDVAAFATLATGCNRSAA
jgi:hypothetical protein